MKEWNFPTGEYGVIIEDSNYNEYDNVVKIYWDWTKEKDVFKICTQINAINNKYPYAYILLYAPYLPYSRQDKIFNDGECVSFDLLLKMLSASANNNYTLSIITNAIHNEQAFHCLSNKYQFSRDNNLFCSYEIIKDLKYNVVFPDKNAEKHFYMNENTNQYYCKKLRGEMGKIISYECDRIKDVTLPTYILDDICDGGATFIKCAEALKAQGVEDIRLFVYHGFFTKGLDALFEAGIKEIYTTNSVCRIEHPNLHIIGEDCYV